MCRMLESMKISRLRKCPLYPVLYVKVMPILLCPRKGIYMIQLGRLIQDADLIFLFSNVFLYFGLNFKL